jgi:homoserine acetyltransferase
MAYLFLPMLHAPAGAHGPNDPPHQTHCMGDLKLESGDAIKDFCISYVTHGTLNAKKSNAILMVTAMAKYRRSSTSSLRTARVSSEVASVDHKLALPLEHT